MSVNLQIIDSYYNSYDDYYLNNVGSKVYVGDNKFVIDYYYVNITGGYGDTYERSLLLIEVENETHIKLLDKYDLTYNNYNNYLCVVDNYVYTVNRDGNCDVFTFSGDSLNLVYSKDISSDDITSFDSDGSYLYTSHRDTSFGVLRVLTSYNLYDGTSASLVELDNVTASDSEAYEVRCLDDKLFLTISDPGNDRGVFVYNFDGLNFSAVDSLTHYDQNGNGPKHVYYNDNKVFFTDDYNVFSYVFSADQFGDIIISADIPFNNNNIEHINDKLLISVDYSYHFGYLTSAINNFYILDINSLSADNIYNYYNNGRICVNGSKFLFGSKRLIYAQFKIDDLVQDSSATYYVNVNDDYNSKLRTDISGTENNPFDYFEFIQFLNEDDGLLGKIANNNDIFILEGRSESKFGYIYYYDYVYSISYTLYYNSFYTESRNLINISGVDNITFKNNGINPCQFDLYGKLLLNKGEYRNFIFTGPHGSYDIINIESNDNVIFKNCLFDAGNGYAWDYIGNVQLEIGSSALFYGCSFCGSYTYWNDPILIDLQGDGFVGFYDCRFNFIEVDKDSYVSATYVGCQSPDSSANFAGTFDNSLNYFGDATAINRFIDAITNSYISATDTYYDQLYFPYAGDVSGTSAINTVSTRQSFWIENDYDFGFDGQSRLGPGAWIFPEGTPSPYITANFSSDPTVGNTPLTVNFTDLSIGWPDDPVSWYWQFGDGTSSLSQNPQHEYSGVGTYVITLSACTSGGLCDTTSDSIYVRGLGLEISSCGIPHDARWRYGSCRLINLVEYLPPYMRDGDVEDFLKLFEDFLNEMFEGYCGLSASEETVSADTSAINTITYDDTHLYNKDENGNYTSAVSKISILEKVFRLTELHDADLIDIDYINFFANYLGYDVNINRAEIGVLSSLDDSICMSADKNEYLRFVVRNLPNWYKIKTTRNAIKVLLYSFGIIGDIVSIFTKGDSTKNGYADFKIVNDEYLINNVSELNNYYPSPHFSISIDLDDNVNEYVFDYENRQQIINAIESIRPINTVFKEIDAKVNRTNLIIVNKLIKYNQFVYIPWN